ncbi:hypothetical protein HYX13_04710 [Candidatus Woesearchaeota archaeon]|nr:hypothetical protein [Candidatus Woesearchaeota archaeon]
MVKELSPALVDRAVGYASELEQLAEQHREYRARASLPEVVASAEDIRQQLSAFLERFTQEIEGEVTPLHKKIAQTAAVMAAAGQGDGEMRNVDYLQYALLLTLESEQGRTNAVKFQQTARFLLAHAPEGYEPMRVCTIGDSVFEVYCDASRDKVILLEQKGRLKK